MGFYKSRGEKRASGAEGVSLAGFRAAFPEAANPVGSAFADVLFRVILHVGNIYKASDYEGVAGLDPELVDWPKLVNAVALLAGKATSAVGSEGAWIRLLWDAWATGSPAVAAAAGEAGGTGPGSGSRAAGEFDSFLELIDGGNKQAGAAAKEDTSFLQGSSKLLSAADFAALVDGLALLAKLDMVGEMIRAESAEGREGAPAIDPAKVTLDVNSSSGTVAALLFPNATAPVSLKEFFSRLVGSLQSPNLFGVLRAFVYTRFLLHGADVPAFMLVQPPNDPVSLYPPLPLPPAPILTPEVMWLLSLWLPREILAGPPAAEGQTEKGRWDLLYQGSEMGFSMNRFESNAFKYPAASLLLLSCRVTKPTSPPTPGIPSGTPGTPLLFAFLNPEPWKMNAGNTAKIPQPLPRSVLALLRPALDVQYPSALSPPPKPTLDRHLLVSPAAGICIGPWERGDGYRLAVDATLQQGRYRHDPVLGGKQAFRNPTYGEQGFSWDFEVLEAAAYGLGGPAARAAQKRSWASEKSEADRRKEVNIRKAGGGVDRDILVMAGVLDDNVEGMGIERYKTDKEKEQERLAREQGLV
ncbi:hypothetical protein DFJ74DRAFT_701643 [Hyaloraphidium curvatum]|nr:hypothetical protein DFJ74DRAFT_701643 [Hyaloraphidium curvatum]